EETSGLDRPTPVAYKTANGYRNSHRRIGAKAKINYRIIGRRYPEGVVAGAGTGEINLRGAKPGFIARRQTVGTVTRFHVLRGRLCPVRALGHGARALFINVWQCLLSLQ